LLTKSEDYYYNAEAVREKTADGDSYRNRRTVWSINTKGYRGAHFAVFPPELIEICLLSGSRPGSMILDPFFGTGTVGEVCLEHDRQCVGIELNPEYAVMAQQRIGGVQKKLRI
jgi:DNA modification methylase